jgi:hypothetical protein
MTKIVGSQRAMGLGSFGQANPPAFPASPSASTVPSMASREEACHHSVVGRQKVWAKLGGIIATPEKKNCKKMDD